MPTLLVNYKYEDKYATQKVRADLDKDVVKESAEIIAYLKKCSPGEIDVLKITNLDEKDASKVEVYSKKK